LRLSRAWQENLGYGPDDLERARFFELVHPDDVDATRADRQTTWSGLRPCTPDGLPYVGRFRRHPNLVAATGHAMIGMTMATATGKLVSQIVQGREPEIDIRALDPDRFA